MFLQSHDEYDLLVEYEPNGNIFKIIKRSSFENQNLISVSGFYALLSGCFLGIYAKQENLYLICEKTQIIFNDNIKIFHEKNDTKRKLIINHFDEKVISIDYVIPNYIQDELDPFSEEEDFDFGMFLAKFTDLSMRNKFIEANNSPNKSTNNNSGNQRYIIG